MLRPAGSTTWLKRRSPPCAQAKPLSCEATTPGVIFGRATGAYRNRFAIWRTDVIGYSRKTRGTLARSTGWRDKVYSRRYQAILVSDEQEAQVRRLVYILSHGCKKNRVARPQDGRESIASPHSSPASRSNLVRSHKGVGSAPARRRGRRSAVHGNGSREARSPALLAAFIAGALPQPDRRVDRGDHRAGRRPASRDEDRVQEEGGTYCPTFFGCAAAVPATPTRSLYLLP